MPYSAFTIATATVLTQPPIVLSIDIHIYSVYIRSVRPQFHVPAAMADDDAPKPPPTLESMFVAFAKFNQPAEFDGSTILLSQLDLWMKQSKLFSKKFTLTDTGMIYNRYK